MNAPLSDETVNKMNPDVKAMWVGALRSGKYKQGKNQLRTDDDCFCCLGVLCDLLSSTGQWELVGGSTKRGYRFKTAQNGAGGFMYMPYRVAEAAGMSASDDAAPMRMNDDGKSFAEIADWIEANL